VYSKLKLSQHKHTGRLRPHEHTSYVPLFVLVLFVGVILLQFSLVSLAAASPGPQAGSVGLTGIMPAKPPTTAAVITSPSNNQHFTTSPVAVSGTCPTDTVVEIFKNDIFGGSASCTDSGTFSLSVDLLYGQNNLVARVYDSLNQAGPDSNTVTVFYDILPPQSLPVTSNNFSNRQMLLETDAVYRGTFPGQAMNVPLTILGGTPGFAVNVSWGDGTNTVIPHGDNTTFNASHTYNRPGTYEITIQASDSVQQVAFLQVATIVNGQPAAANATGSDDSNVKAVTNKLLVLWPLWAIILAVVVSFWLGEQREKRILAAATPVPQAT
jgi:hypothetical protein